MVNEAVIRNRLEETIDFTVADGTGIEKGALLELTDNRTAVAVTGSGAMIAGIAAREKISGDGRTRLACYRRGIFDFFISGAVVIGDRVAAGGADNVVVALGLMPVKKLSGSAVIGTVLEVGSNGKRSQVDVNRGAAG